MSILILGATGNTGAELVRQLQANNHEFYVMARSDTAADKLNLNVDQVRIATFDDSDKLTQAMQGIRKIYVAMPAHPSNEDWMVNIINAAKTASVEQVVKLSGMGAAKDANSEIIRTHVVTDDLLKNSGLGYTIVQPNSFFQNLYGSLGTINAMGKFFLPLANAKQSVVDIRDVAAVALTALTQDGHTGETYLLSGPQALTFSEQAQMLSQAAGKPIEYVAVSQDDAEQAMKQAGMDDWTAEKLAEILAWFGEGHYATVTDTVERVTSKPARTFSAFAEEFAHAVQ
ncbi:SDR family oxidoreductase [Paraferrimonas haliotis]|uniref:NAD(P)-dependent oxidoreductase n=1 Tax=Paraferrimonas haliotis TaxID=2013866 RepID=A0AA37TPE1_9GAMM|nr:SDR family oxidoreductase [Paraferrimonas haliotis]GLS84448.1 NAD(P)-dependent oxidoreductase [Paraferrimonas haliotis]